MRIDIKITVTVSHRLRRYGKIIYIYIWWIFCVITSEMMTMLNNVFVSNIDFTIP